MRKLLTDKAIGWHAKRPPATGRLEIFDTVRTGLCFRVTANGAASWSHVYRHNGELRRDTLGPYPLVTLAKARQRVQEAQEAIGRGDDPRTVKASVQAAQAQQAADTADAVAEQFILKHARQRRWRDLERTLRRDLLPRWEGRPLASITRREIIAVVDDVVARGAPVQANRVLTCCKRFFGWALDRDIIENDPTNRVRKPTKEFARERVLTAQEIRAFWHACTAVGAPFGELAQVLLLSGQRKGELQHLEWPELNADARRIEIAGAKYKTGRPHAVPVSDAALAILQARPKITGCRWVFTTDGRTFISAFSKAKVRIDRAMLAYLRQNDPKATLKPWVFHDLRRTLRSGLSELGIMPHVAERILGHVIGGVAGVYDRGSYEPQMRHALDAWAQHVAGIVNPPSDKVVKLAGRTRG